MSASNGRRSGRHTNEVVARVNLKCYACDRVLKKPHAVYTGDAGGQRQFVGPECFQYVLAAGAIGYQPPRGGPRLYPARPADAASGVKSNPEA